MTELPIRPGTTDDWSAIARLMATVFHNTVDEESSWGKVFEQDRSLVVDDGGAIVGHAAAFTRDLTVPGGPVPAAHVTMVGVAPTHRRRRLLTRLMHRQLAEATEPVAVLWASEGRIYPRFGYGLASQRVSFRIDNREIQLPEPASPGRLRTVPAGSDALADLRPVYEDARPDRPGWSSRDERWWTTRTLSDPPDRRAGGTELRATLHDGGAGIDGYVLWRTKGDWSAAGPEGEVIVQELVATNPAAHLALWRFLLAIDLTRSASWWLGGLDDPLLHLANEPRRLGMALGDGLYVRIVDLPAALTARRYPADTDVVLEVTDPVRPGNAGRWRLTVDGGKATCTRTAEPADLACGITELGAAYLGGIPLAGLAAAGRVRELRPDTLAAASTAFGWPRPPHGNEIF